MIRSGIRAALPLRGRANCGLWNPIETRKASLLGVANQRFTALAEPVAALRESGAMRTEPRFLLPVRYEGPHIRPDVGAPNSRESTGSPHSPGWRGGEDRGVGALVEPLGGHG